MNVNVSGAFIYFIIPIFGGIPITQTTVSSFIVAVLICALSVYFGKRLKKRPDGWQVLVEKGIMMMHNMVLDTMGAHNAAWTPVILTIFLSSICGSLIGLTGFLRSSTADLSCTLVWALSVTGIIWYNNIKNNGFVGWLKGFTEPVVVMTPMNIVSEIAQPISMAFRHFGNVAGGGVITSILYTALSLLSAKLIGLVSSCEWLVGVIVAVSGGALLAVYFLKQKKLKHLIFGGALAALGVFGLLEKFGILSGVPIFAYGIPAVLSVYFDIFSGFVQALVFSLLSMVYISGSLPEPAPEN